MSSFTVKAILSAVDKNFSSTFQKANSTIDSLSGKIKSGLGFGILTGIGQQAFAKVTNGISGMVGELNNSSKAWQTFEGNMGMLGKSKKEIAQVRGELQDFATKTIYSASDMASTFSQLEAVGTKNTAKLVKGFGGLAAAAENPQQAMKTLSMQATQMAAKPMVQWMDFKLMLEQTPAGIAAVAKQMGKSTSELVADVQKGTVKTQEFFDAIAEVGTNADFTKLATSYKTVDQAMDGLKETLSVKLEPAWKKVSDVGIKAVSGLISKVEEMDFSPLETGFDKAMKVMGRFTKSISNTGAFAAVKNAFLDIGKSVGHVVSSLVDSGIGTVIGNIAKAAANAVSVVAKFVSGLDPGIISGFTAALAGVVVGIKGLNFINKFNPFNLFKKNADDALADVVKKSRGSKSKLSQVFNGIGNVIAKTGTAIGTAAKGIGTGLKSAFQGITPAIKGLGTAVSTAAKGIGTGLSTALKGLGAALKMANPVNILALGTAIGIITATFALLATQGDGVATIIASIGTAFANAAPFVTAIGNVLSTLVTSAITAVANALMIVAPILPTIASAIAMLSPIITAFGQAFATVATAVGGAISQIISAITPIVPIIAEAFTQCVLIVSNAIVQIVQALAPFIPSLADIVQSVSEAVQSIAEAFTSLVSQISPIIDSISNLVSTLGTTISDVFTSIGDVITSVGDAISGVLDSIAGVIESVGTSALNAGKGFKKLAEGLRIITNLPLLDMGASLAAVATGIGAITAVSGGLAKAGSGMQAFSNGIIMVAQAGPVAVSALMGLANAIAPLTSIVPTLPPVMSQASSAILTFASGVTNAFASLIVSTAVASSFVSTMSSLSGATTAASGTMSVLSTAVSRVTCAFQSVASRAQRAGSSVKSLVSVAASALTALTRLGTEGQRSMKQLDTAFKNTERQAKTSGKGIGDNLHNGVKSGLGKLPSMANSAVNVMISTLNAARGRAFSSGSYIGQGLASGLRSQVGAVRAAAAQLASAADAAIRAKARIHSPSKVTTEDGEFMGKGLVKGLKNMYSDVWKTAEDLVMIPTLAAMRAPDIEFVGGYGNTRLANEYSYENNHQYTVIVPVELDGKEVARITAPYTEEELNKRERRNRRKKGKV